MSVQTSGSNKLLEIIEKHAQERGCTDILVNGTQLWVDRGQGLHECPMPSEISGEDVRRLAVRMAAQAERRLDQASPIVDARMPHGWRLHAVIPPVSPQTLMSIRIPKVATTSLDDFVRFGWDMDSIEWVKRLVRARANVLVSGGTGSGKTTLLTAALGYVDHHERLVCIEEVPEIFPLHPHCVHLHERAPNIQGKGAVTLSELVRAAMRMRPDRMILGECRGPEVRDVMTALNTGHEGGWATIHANSPADVPARLWALGSLAGMSDSAVTSQAASAFDAVIHMGRGCDGQRFIASIAVPMVVKGSLTCEYALIRGASGQMACGQAWEALAEIGQRGSRA